MVSTRTMGRDGATLRARGWDSSSLRVGTFDGAGPLGFAAGDANLYRYVGNDPTNATDPTGLEEQHFSGPYGPRWNEEKNVAEVYFMIDYTPSWYNYIQPWWSYTPTPSKEKVFPVPTLSKQDVTYNGIKNLDYPILVSLELQIAYATGIQNALTTGRNNAAATSDGLVMGAVLPVFSILGKGTKLAKEAEVACRNTAVQQEMNDLTRKLTQGNMNPGINTRFLFNGIYEARGANGARLYFRRQGDIIQILAKSSKSNQNTVISILQDLYGN